MIEHASQADLADGQDPYKALFFELRAEAGQVNSHFPVAVKNLTTSGVILEILHHSGELNYESLKGQEGRLLVLGHDDCIVSRTPGRIHWVRSHDGDSGLTLGLEFSEPLPLTVRHVIEASLAIGARDMKVLWDYWDQIQASEDVVEPLRPPEPMSCTVAEFVPPAAQADSGGSGNWIYYVGFGAILVGLAMQFPQSESLGFSGLVVMFGGSLVVAWKSIMSMWQVTSSNPAD